MNLDNRRCLQCNYLLTALREPRCPECGHRFDLNDPATFNTGRALTWLDRRLRAPPGKISFTLVLLLCGWVLYVVLDPQFYHMGIWVILCILLFAGVTVILVVRDGLRWLILPPQVYRPQNYRQHRIALAMALITSLLVSFHVPLRVAFLFARPQLERIVAETTPENVWSIPPRRAGIYTVAASAYGGDDTIFLNMRGRYSGGFAYCPTKGPRGYYNDGADGHLFGPWYWWTDD